MERPEQFGRGPRERSIRRRVRQAMVSGLAITVPILVTLFVFRFAVSFLLNSVNPLARVIEAVSRRSSLTADVVAVLFLLGLIFLIGLVAESDRASGRLEASFDRAMSSLPGLGSVYSSFNEMSQLLLDSDTQSFQEVKLVEYPTEGSYTIGFVVADTPQNIRDAAGREEMTTLYMPFAPNPVMGGFVMHVSQARLHDVDMTVEEGIQSIVTSGIAVEDPQEGVPATVDGSGPVDPPRHSTDES